ncbi:MAG: DUF1566 domain-containing protein [Gammaproteobacteria bacterium]|nr:DUF1566 domain-containing protein [Gammaproteobacteria bacterium]MBU4112613.1 DUF1566 domain-containing protein [Gammaproteobacteria bacterium]MBU4169946.1 DUF1566 domain-containing protein [Gammaproteobacteria bacterium]
MLEFVVNLDKAVLRSLVISFNTSSTAKVGFESTGSAKGGVCATAGVDYVAVTNTQVTIPAGSSAGRLTVEVCPDAVFEPNESLKLNWTSPGSAGGVVTGTIINDDAGGLNGTGATTLLGGLSAFGRDANPLTNAASDGALGFWFDKSNSGCVIDKVTGLTWQKLPVPGVTMKYDDLAAYVTSVKGAAPCAFSDWRVPTVNELLSLMDASKTTGNPVNADYMNVAADAMTDKFWTIESRAVQGGGVAADAWQLDASNGAAVSYVEKNKVLGVRLVRGGTVAAPVCNNDDGRFNDFNDGTIDDRVTGLMWKTCPEGYAYSGGACTAAAGSKVAFTANADVVPQLAAANAAKASGYSDWRIPTKNELASLVSRACSGAAIDSKFVLGAGNLNFVTATLDADAPTTRVWGISFEEGSIGPNSLSDSFKLRLVRAGQ